MSEQKQKLNYYASISIGMPEDVLPLEAQTHLVFLLCAENRFI